MANAYEYPGTNYEQGNYDFFITEVKEFNRKLDEYQEEVNRKLADQDAEIVNFKTVVNGQINQLRGQLADFERELNQAFEDYKTQVNTSMGDYERRVDAYVSQQLDAFEEQVESINENISVYLEQNLPTIVDENEDLKEAIVSAAQLVGWRYAGYFMYNQVQPTDPLAVDVFPYYGAGGALVLVVPKENNNSVSALYLVMPSSTLAQNAIRLAGNDSEYVKLEFGYNPGSVYFSNETTTAGNPMMDVYVMPLDNSANS